MYSDLPMRTSRGWPCGATLRPATSYCASRSCHCAFSSASINALQFALAHGASAASAAVASQVERMRTTSFGVALMVDAWCMRRTHPSLVASLSVLNLAPRMPSRPVETSRVQYRFGPFRLDAAARQLWVADAPARLGARAFDL